MKPQLSVLVLAKDEEARLPRFFASLRGLKLAHEVVLVDTGSKDKTIALAKRARARVLRRPWDGFAATRNRAMADCRAPWIWVARSSPSRPYGSA